MASPARAADRIAGHITLGNEFESGGPTIRFPTPDSRLPIPDSQFPIPNSQFPIPEPTHWPRSSDPTHTPGHHLRRDTG
ncbi:hypothetical protein XspCFBP7912_09140 [Xanthomonas sp. CFBP 7912]|nr:hypothetical protein XspCFBP7912_09140 [Xanthomonas sp. CFBP 7912]